MVVVHSDAWFVRCVAWNHSWFLSCRKLNKLGLRKFFILLRSYRWLRFGRNCFLTIWKTGLLKKAGQLWGLSFET
jgi:hypothetical protein